MPGFELVRIDPSSLSPDAVVRVRLAPLPGGRHFRLHHPENPKAGLIGDDLVLTYEDAKLLTGILHDVLGTLARGRRAQAPRRPWNKFEDGPQEDRARPDGIPDQCD